MSNNKPAVSYWGFSGYIAVLPKEDRKMSTDKSRTSFSGITHSGAICANCGDRLEQHSFGKCYKPEPMTKHEILQRLMDRLHWGDDPKEVLFDLLLELDEWFAEPR
jgi:hypothetical protein